MVPDHSQVRWLSQIDDLRNHISHENVTLHIYILLFFIILAVLATAGAHILRN